MTSANYVPSGRLPLAAIPYTVASAAAALPAAWIYAYPAASAPTFVRPFFALLFGLFLGVCTSYAAKNAKARNPAWMGRLGLVIGFAGWYFHWAAYSAIILRRSGVVDTSLVENFVSLVARPYQLLGIAAGLYERGTGTIAGVQIDGWLLVIVWIAEFLFLLGIADLYGRSKAREPFCETSYSWAAKTDLPGKFAFIKETDELVRAVQSDPRELFTLLTPWSAKGQLSYSKATVYRCAGGGDAFISIQNTEVVPTESKIKKTNYPAVEFLRLPDPIADELIRQAGALQNEHETATALNGPAHPELLPSIEHLEAGRFQAALDCAVPYVQSEQRKLRVDAIRLAAIATSQMDQWNESLSFWDSLFRQEQTAHNALQVANASVMSGDVSRGEAWLARALKMNATTGEIEGPLLLTNFVTALSKAGHMKAALPYLDEIKGIYISLGITDSTFLYIRKVPFFSAFLDNSAPVIHGVLGTEQGRAWYTSMLPHLDENGRTELTEWLENGFMPKNGEPGAA